MTKSPFLTVVSLLALVGCHHSTPMTNESLVLPAEQPANLLYTHINPSSVRVHAGPTTFSPITDYTLDPAAGTIARKPFSRIPDYSKNVLYHQKDFIHDKFPGFTNTPFTIYVDYTTNDPSAAIPLAPSVDASAVLSKTAAKLRAGQPVKIIAYGDSITAGGEASTPALQYPARYASYLRTQFPKSTITLENTATGGDNTVNGLQRLDAKVLSRSPDLVLVAFGMNDHNILGVGGVPPADFQANLISITTQIKDKTGADVILLSCFEPNPDWHYGTHNMPAYAAATQFAATQTHSAYADINAIFAKVRTRKDPQSLLANNINHPNDFGHWLYLQALIALKF